MTETPDNSEQPQWTTSRIAALVDGNLVGDPHTLISGVSTIEDAEEGDLVFADSPRYLESALRSRASAVLVANPGWPEDAVPSRSLIIVPDPRLAFVRVLEEFSASEGLQPGIDPSAHLGQGHVLGTGVHIAEHVSVGNHVTLAEGVVLLPGVRIGDGCRIGAGSILHPNVVLYPGVTVGRRCILHAGCVIGADGFGFVPVGRSLRKVPHLGTVEIGDEVEIGANTCIDRAKTGATIIGAGTKIDNLVHVAHNVQIGMGCILVAQSGIAGSVTLGHGVVLAGQAGIKDHVTLGDGARVGAQGGVIGDVPTGVSVSGYPARPHAQKMREYAASAALPDYLKRIRSLEKRLAALEKSVGEND